MNVSVQLRSTSTPLMNISVHPQVVQFTNLPSLPYLGDYLTLPSPSSLYIPDILLLCSCHNQIRGNTPPPGYTLTPYLPYSHIYRERERERREREREEREGWGTGGRCLTRYLAMAGLQREDRRDGIS
jgi:hypothetical protein